jgi:hypothetical protein
MTRDAGYIIFGVSLVLGAVMIASWCYERFVAPRARGRR